MFGYFYIYELYLYDAIADVVNQYYEITRLIPCDQKWKERSAKALDELANLREFLNKDMAVLV